LNHQAFIGHSERREDTVWPLLALALSATLNVPLPSAGELPPLWHWMLFQEWAPAAALGADGHARRGGFLPLDPALPRRMWAGGRLRFHHALRIGERVTRESIITAVEEKTGSSGRLLFVNVRHTIGDGRGVALIEEQDLVYREAPAGQSTPSPVTAPGPAAVPIPVSGGIGNSVAVDALLLFRYSAVTGNSHRIHYDKDYVNEEGYASLVVHGPLQAILLAGLALQQRAAGALEEFSFRSRHPALLHRCPLTLQAWPDTDCLRLRSVDREGEVCTTAEAKFNA
jgi:hydroxyacyl-ACP dehydratase HTD2-like protein with hotdog domain